MNELVIPDPRSLEIWLDGHIGPWMGGMAVAFLALTVALVAHGLLYVALAREPNSSACASLPPSGTAACNCCR